MMVSSRYIRKESFSATLFQTITTYWFRLFSIGALLISTIPVSANPLSKRGTAQDVINDIYAIQAGVQTLTTDTTNFNSGSFLTGLVEGTPILLDVVNIHLANRKGYLDATTATKFSNSDSVSIVNVVTDTVVVSIPDGVNVLKSKKANFQQAGQVPIVIASLELLLNDHDTFSAAVVAKLTLDAADLAEANAGIATIHNALANGIAYFESWVTKSVRKVGECDNEQRDGV